METLGLSGKTEREDNFFQRLFWPTVRNQYDVDLLGRRGFWMAFTVGLFSALVLLVQRHPYSAMFALLVFLLGAAGIRRRSVAASAMVFTIYFVGLALQWAAMTLGVVPFSNPLVGVFFCAILLSAVRATVLSKRFAGQGDGEFPERVDGRLMDAVVNRFPAAVWPRLAVVFFVFATGYLVLSAIGSVYLMHARPVAAHAGAIPAAAK